MLANKQQLIDFDDIKLPKGTMHIIRHSSSSSSIPVSLHYHDHYEAYYVVSGSIIYTVEGCNYKLEPGTLLLIPPFEQHQFLPQRDAAFERIAVRFSEDALVELSSSDFDLSSSFNPSSKEYVNFLSLNDAQQGEMLYILKGLLRESCSSSFGSVLSAKAFLTQFLVLVNRIALDDDSDKFVKDTASSLVDSIVEYIELNFFETITLDSLERMFNINKYQISRDFSRIVGCPLHKYLVQNRLTNALSQLKSGVSPQVAAVNCGFGDYSNFYRQFRTTYGTSPRGYINDKR